MGMSDCSKCWDTPCTCGYHYLFWDDKHIDELIAILTKVKKAKKKLGRELSHYPGDRLSSEEFNKLMKDL